MATAVATVSLTDQRSSWVEGNKYNVLANVAISASPATYVPGGIPMSFFAPLVKASRTPVRVTLQGQAGYIYTYVPGVDASAGLLQIWVQNIGAADPLAELGQIAIPAAVSGDTITALALFNGML